MKIGRDIEISGFDPADLYAEGTDDEFDYFRQNAEMLQEWSHSLVTLRLRGKVRAIGGVVNSKRGPFAVLTNNIKHGEIRLWDLAELLVFANNFLLTVSKEKDIPLIFADVDLTKDEEGRSVTDLWFATKLKFIPCAVEKNVYKAKRMVILFAWKANWEN
jgi:hypothetical protein